MDSKELYLQSFKNIQSGGTKMCKSVSALVGPSNASQLSRSVPLNQEFVDKEISQQKRSDFFAQYKKLGGQKQIAQTKLSDKGKGRLMIICKDKSNAPSRSGSFLNKSNGNSLKIPPLNSPVLCHSPGKSKGGSFIKSKLSSPTSPKMFITDVVNSFDEVSLTALPHAHKELPPLNLSQMDDPVLSPIPKRISKKTGASHVQINVPRYAHAEIAVLSPRSHYMDACLRSRINPRPALVSKLTDISIQLQHQVKIIISTFLLVMCIGIGHYL